MAPRYNRKLLAGLGAALTVALVSAQDAKCYYPSGNEAPEKPCSSAEGSACCPDKWQCLDNGLCHYPNDNLYGRYSCTDKSWKADGCPSNLCVYGLTATGGESITQCKDHNNDWCCNANAVDVKCCEKWPVERPFFSLPDGNQYAIVGSRQANSAPKLASITGEALPGQGGGNNNNRPSATPSPSSSNNNNNDSPSSSDSPGSSGSSARVTAESTPITNVATSFSTGISGSVQTIVQTSVVLAPAATPASTDPNSTEPKKKSKLPLIIGLAVGIPLVLALAAILIWLLRKRRNQKLEKEKNPYTSTPDLHGTDGFAGGAKMAGKSGGNPEIRKASDPGMPELMSQSVGPARPVSTIKGHAELDSGTGFNQGTVPYGPNTVGVGGGNSRNHTPASSWGSAPPGYSPGMHSNGFAGAAAMHSSNVPPPPPGVAEAPDTSIQPGSRPGTGGTAGSGAAGAVVPPAQQQYTAYRPPQGHDTIGATSGPMGANAHQLTDVPEAQELSTVRTPPATEMSAVKTPPA